ncbi:MAG: hypothetical protein F6K41_11440 [Symploca sp. SIO3E6]|nr:hypothetical protein [Caldora sp. SIO3E6]
MATKNPHCCQLIAGSTYTEIVSNQILKQVEAYQTAYLDQKIYMMGFEALTP